MIQFDLTNHVFDDYQLDEENSPIIRDGWVLVESQEQVDMISESITHNGSVWIEDDELYTSGKSPTPYHTWDVESKSWVVDDSTKETIQTSVWEAIKQKRFNNTRGGVYVKSVGKWFHNDDPSRTQYLALQTLPQLPPNLMWKTMDNTFVAMTKELLLDLAMTMLIEEQSDFTNAEKHRIAMMKVDEPWNYDFSTGWSKTYEG